MTGDKPAAAEQVASAIPPSPDDVDPRYIAARNRYNEQVVDFLDAIDPEVATVTNLSDMQNSLFVPNLGAYLQRARPFRLTRPPPRPPVPDGSLISWSNLHPSMDFERNTDGPAGSSSDTESVVRAGEFLVMPTGVVDWEALTEDERRELDEYVRYLLHSKKERLRRIWRGFKQYVKTPLGAFIVVYASLLTFWGAAWVLFLIGWLSAGSRQAYFVEICDQILTAPDVISPVGLAPFRAVDTYHMIYIARLHSKTLRLRKERGLPPLVDDNDLPRDLSPKEEVLTEEEQRLLVHHQDKLSSNHTFYRPHETATHQAFPLDLLIATVCILDCHSLFQIALGSATWSISYHHGYKRILTAVILSLSISCNITGGILILIGNRRTRKKEVLERRLMEALSEEAIRRKEKAQQKQIMRETVEEKEARLRAEAGPGIFERVKETIEEEGASGLLEKMKVRSNDSGGSSPRRSASGLLERTEGGGQSSPHPSSRKGVPPSKSANASLEIPRADREKSGLEAHPEESESD
ncbi:hypothetical protein AURDEDRAFT_60593 [Auricularia subglabra TFB-10046 SS5]|nr:hypothetical protein AURDEDRAFT_60593 [Auricularia subglabra TFB-10046 SS5]